MSFIKQDCAEFDDGFVVYREFVVITKTIQNIFLQEISCRENYFICLVNDFVDDLRNPQGWRVVKHHITHSCVFSRSVVVEI